MQERKLVHIVHYIEHGGGPSGYLYNLKQSIDSDSPIEIVPLKNRKLRNKSLTKRQKITRYIKNNLRTLYQRKKDIGDVLKIDENLVTQQVLDTIFNNNVFISHILTFSNFWIENHKNSGVKHFVFNHSPVDGATEIYTDLQIKKFIKNDEQFHLRLARQELKIYESVDGIVLPCKEAVESYFDFNDELKKRFENILRSKQVIEIPTGAPALIPGKDCDAWYNKYAIPKNKLIVGYFGRYHTHKGFDIFCEVAKLASTVCDDIFFISAGKPAGIIPLKLKNYKNIGMLDKNIDLPNAMNCCNAVLIPNRATYFDLVTIEAMSLAKCVITSNTGGNKFMAANSEGILLFDKFDPESILSVILKNKEELKVKGEINYNRYIEMFSEKEFLQRHIQLAKELIK